VKRLDPATATAMIPLSLDKDFQLFQAWLDCSFKTALRSNIDLRGEEAVRGQGYAEALRDILDALEDPRKLAEKFRK
jgi:hypothetical protein